MIELLITFIISAFRIIILEAGWGGGGGREHTLKVQGIGWTQASAVSW